jgi:sterol desaturase/sphingolipid hydroxylase (fatty acid hydroxylase superfamily)
VARAALNREAVWLKEEALLDAPMRIVGWIGATVLGDARLLVPAGLAFIAITLLVKGRAAMAAACEGLGEIRLNFTYHYADILMVAPVLALVLGVLSPARWNLCLAWSLPPAATALLVVVVGDFIGYWRHRLEHCPLLWPAHAVHHSDRAMTWISQERFHPVNRLTTVTIDLTLLAALGFPVWAIFLNGIVRHLYGQFEHCDLPWDYGPLGKLFISPRAHRWHHATLQSLPGVGCNFATIFSLFDVLFGTYYCAPARPQTGVEDPLPSRWIGQILYPFAVWRRWLCRSFARISRA